jgi:cytochrome c-type biogenesis protein CcmH/NrfG
MKMTRSAVALVLPFLICNTAIFAQNRPDSIQDAGVLNYWTTMDSQARAGGFLFGKLSIEGDPLLWEPIPITVTCDGATKYTAQTDAKNTFTISSANIPGFLNLRGDAKRQMEAHFEGCVVQAVSPGYTSTTLTITHHNLSDEPQLGTLKLTHKEGSSTGSIGNLTRDVPIEAKGSYTKAHTYMLDNKPERAIHELQKAVQIEPKFSEAWYELGKLELAFSVPDAMNSFQQAVASNPNFILPYYQLASLDIQQKKWPDALQNADHALKLEPEGTAELWYDEALADFQLGRYEAAKGAAQKAYAKDPLHTIPNTEQLLAVVLVREKDYPDAITHLRNCLTYLPSGPGADFVKQQIAHLEQLQVQPGQAPAVQK